MCLMMYVYIIYNIYYCWCLRPCVMCLVMYVYIIYIAVGV